MYLYNLFLIVFLITYTYADEIHFEFPEELPIGSDIITSYTNDVETDGKMDLFLHLDDGKEFELKEVVCRAGKGQFKWDTKKIPKDTVGYFNYRVYGSDYDFEGDYSSKVKFVASKSSSSSSAEKDDDNNKPTPTDNTPQNAPSEATNVNPDDIIVGSSSNGIQAGNSTVENQNQVNNNNVQQDIPLEQPKPQEQENTQTAKQNVENKTSNNNNKDNYLLYIGGGSGIFVVALTGLFIAYKVKSKKSLSDFEFDSRPYNNTSMDISQMQMQSNLLNGNLAPVNILGSPSFNDSKGSQYGLYNNNNNPKTYHVPNIESNGSALLLSPSLSNLSANMTNSYYNNNNKNKDKSKRNTYEMISPYDPRETSYQNFTGNFDDSLVLDNNGIINLNSTSNNFGVDVNKLPKSENYSANPRSGSLPRNKVPNDIAVPLMDDEDDEENKKNYRSSILSYISSNRGSFYGAAQAEHSISHILLNQVCTVAYASQPENEDELYLCVGDKVKILEVYDDGWAYSLHISSGLEGMIPLNCTAEYYQ